MNSNFFYGERPDTSSSDSDDLDFSVSSDDSSDDLSYVSGVRDEVKCTVMNQTFG